MSDNTPYLPLGDIKVERAIGRFIIAWGALEREIDSAIHELMLTGLGTGALVTANLAIRAKLDLAHGLFEQLRGGDDPIWRAISLDWERRFDKLINMTAKANAEARIPIVHSQPMAMRLEGGDRPFWVRMTARKGGLKGSGVTYSKEYLDLQTKGVIELIHEWAAARAHWKRGIHAMRSADADEWLGRSPDEEGHLTLQIQSGPDSETASPKPKRQRKPSRRQKREAHNLRK
jgi:hypothetical protein